MAYSNSVLEQTNCPVPANLEVAVGYVGEQRYVGWWSARYDLNVDDGVMPGRGYPLAFHPGWMLFTMHPRPHAALAEHFPSPGGAMTTILILDRQERVLYSAELTSGRQFLHDHADVKLPPQHPARSAGKRIQGQGRDTLLTETRAMIEWLENRFH